MAKVLKSKKRVAEEAPLKRKKKVAAVEAPVKKKKKVVEEAAPVKKKKKKVVEEVSTKKKKKAVKAEKPAKAKKVKPVEVIKPVKEKLKVTALVERLADDAELDKKEVKRLLEALSNLMRGSIVKKGVGEFQLPGLFKIVTKHIPAKKGGEKKISPFTGEQIITKAKPATVRVKVRPLKKLKDAALQ